MFPGGLIAGSKSGKIGVLMKRNFFFFLKNSFETKMPRQGCEGFSSGGLVTPSRSAAEPAAARPGAQKKFKQ